MKTVDFFYDLGSPASYLAWTQLPALCRRQDAELRYRPFVLGAVFKASGNASPAAVPAKGRYVMRDLERWARKWGVPFQYNPHFPIDTVLLMKMAAAVQVRLPERFDDFHRAIFTSFWIEPKNLGDLGVLAQVLQSASFNPSVMQSLIGEVDVRDALRNNTSEATTRGAFGAPTFFVGDEMFWGQDRLPMLEEALAAQA